MHVLQVNTISVILPQNFIWKKSVCFLSFLCNYLLNLQVISAWNFSRVNPTPYVLLWDMLLLQNCFQSGKHVFAWIYEKWFIVQMEAIQGLDPDCSALIANVWSIVCSTCSMDLMSIIRTHCQIRMDPGNGWSWKENRTELPVQQHALINSLCHIQLEAQATLSCDK